MEFCKSEKKFLNATTCECEEPIVKKLDPGVTGKRTGMYEAGNRAEKAHVWVRLYNISS